MSQQQSAASAADEGRRFNELTALLTEVLDAGGSDPWLFSTTEQPQSAVMTVRLAAPTWWVAVTRLAPQEASTRFWRDKGWVRWPVARLSQWSVNTAAAPRARSSEAVMILARPERLGLQHAVHLALRRRGAHAAEMTTVRRLPLTVVGGPSSTAEAFRHLMPMSPDRASGGRRSAVRGVCGHCGRGLSDQASLARGHGPSCWRRLRLDGQQLHGFAAPELHARHVIEAVQVALRTGVLG